tara:strand:- start:807 stop:1340 length:534 start_codon:yes stop_codon:yes gene_type:complete
MSAVEKNNSLEKTAEDYPTEIQSQELDNTAGTKEDVIGYEFDASDSEDDSDDEEIKKLENSINKDVLTKFHPEIKQINYNELVTLSKIVKNKNGIPVDPLHKTIPFLTKYERAKVLGLRAKQINSGSDIFVEVPPNVFDGYTIAKMELEQKKIPFIIRRPLPNGTSEYWNLSDLEIL